MRLAGQIGLGVGPVTEGFWKKFRADLKKQNTPNVDVPVNPALAKFRAEMRAERLRQQANGIRIPVSVDEKGLRRAEPLIKRIENVYKRSEGNQAIRLNVMVTGAAALPALASGAASAAVAITDLSRAAALLPGAFSALGAVVGTAALGLRGLGDAFSASAESSGDAAQKMADFKDAARDLARAQKDVGDAVRDATRQLEDQKDSLADNKLSVERAALNVQKANEKLAAGGFKTVTDYKDAILDQKEAVLRLHEAVKTNKRGIQDFYTAQTQGVTKSDAVTSAVDRLSSAVERMDQAQQKASQTSDKLSEAMAKLSPGARDFVNQIKGLSGAWQQLQFSTQDALLSGVGQAISDLAQKRLPLLQEGMRQVAQGLNADFKQVLSTLGTDVNADRFAKIFEQTGRFLNMIQPGINSLVNAFAHISEVGARFLPRLANAFNTVMGKFESFIDRADKDGSLEKWIDRGMKAWASLGRSIVQVGRILGGITRAYETATGNVGGLVSTLERGLTGLADYLNSAEGQRSLVSYISDTKEFLSKISESIPDMLKIFKTIGDTMRQFATMVWPAIATIGRFLAANEGLVKALGTLFLIWKTITPLARTGFKWFDRLRAGMQAYTKAIQDHEAKKLDLQNQIDWATREEKIANREVMRHRARVGQLKAEADIELLNTERLRKARVSAAADVAKAEAAVAQQLPHTQRANAGKSTTGKDYSSSYIQGQQTALRNRTSELENAKRNLAAADDAFAISFQKLTEADRAVRVSQMDVQQAMLKSGEAMKMANTASQNLENTGFRKLRDGIGSAKGTGLIGRLGALMGAIGGWAIGGAVSAVASAGVIFGLMKLADAQQRAGDRADYHRQMVDGLKSSLDGATGAVTREAENMFAKEATDVQITGRNNNTIHRNAIEDAASLGVSLEDFKRSIDPTQGDAYQRATSPLVKEITDLVRGGRDEQWNKFGEKLTELGVNLDTYVAALGGDDGAIAKFNQAVDDMNDLPDWTTGAAQRMGDLPELGRGAQNLVDAGSHGLAPLQKINEGLNAARAGGDAARQTATPRKLNQAGMGVFGPGLDPSYGVRELPNGDGVGFNLNNVSPERKKQLQDLGARLNLLDAPTQRYSVTLDGDLLHQYVEGYAKGGPVWGAGSATSDSIPAMLSNGEYVINAKSARLLGHDTLDRLNRGGPAHFDGGGDVSLIDYLKNPPLLSGANSIPGSGNRPGDFNRSEFQSAGQAQAARRGMDTSNRPDPAARTGPVAAAIGNAAKALLPHDFSETRTATLGTANSAWNALNNPPASPKPVNPALTTTPQGVEAWQRYALGRPLSSQTPPVGTGPITRTAPVDPNHPEWDPNKPWSTSNPFGYVAGEQPGQHHTGAPGVGNPPGPTPHGDAGGVQPGLLPAEAGPSTPSPSSPSSPGGAPLPPGFPSYEQIPGGASGPPPDPATAQDRLQALYSTAEWAEKLVYDWGGGGPGTPQYGESLTQDGNLGGFDCSGLVWAMANVATGRPWNSGSKFGTGTEGARLAEYGFLPGKPPGGATTGYLIVGWNAGHTAMTLPDGRGFEAQSTNTGIILGQGSGAFNSSFTNFAYLPMSASSNVTSGLPAPLQQQFTAPPSAPPLYIPSTPPSSSTPPPSLMAPALTPPSAASSVIPGAPQIPGLNAPIPGPFGNIPFDPMSILKTIGETILQAILGFFGIDISPIINAANQIVSGIGDMPGMKAAAGDVQAQIDGAQDLTQEPNSTANTLLQMAADAKARGDDALAKSYYEEAVRQANGGIAAQNAYNANPPGYALGGLVGFDEGGSVSDQILKNLVTPPSIAYAQNANGGQYEWGGVGPTGVVNPHTAKQSGGEAQWGTSWDCSGIAGSVWAADLGLPTGIRYFTTDTDFTKLGFAPGYRDGVLNIGTNGLVGDKGHMAATLANGVNVESAGSGKGVNYGGPALGAQSPMFNKQYHFDPNAMSTQDMVANLRPEAQKALLRSAFSTPASSALTASFPMFTGVNPGYARGGHVRGKGGPRSDSIPAMLSNGEYVMRASAVKAIGVDRLNAMNRYADGGLVLPWLDPNAQTGPPPGPAPAPPSAPGAGDAPTPAPTPDPAAPVGPQSPGAIAQGVSSALGGSSLLSGIGGLGAQGGVEGGGRGQGQQDTRGILAVGPTDDDYTNPAISSAIQGAAGTIGGLLSTAASMAGGAAGMGAPGAGAGGQVAGQFIQAGAQIAGQVATGAVNVLSALGVGTVTPSQTGQGYGTPLTAPAPQAPGGFSSIHNGDIYTNNLDEYNRMRDRKEAQKTAPFFNRVGV